MPLYEYRCDTCGWSAEVRLAIENRNKYLSLCECIDGTVRRALTAAVQLNPPTGAALRSHFGLFQEATQEIGHAYAKAEAVEERALPAPDLWSIAKTRAQAMVAAGEAPSIANPLKE